MKAFFNILIFIVISSTIHAQVDSTKNFSENEITKVKDEKGDFYFLMEDYSVLNIRSCFNSEVCIHKFYLAKFNYRDYTLHLIGEGKNINDSSRFDVFNMYVGIITDKNYLVSSYKFEKLSYGVFDVIFKVKPGEYLFFNMGNYSDQLEGVMLYSMDSFRIYELIYGKQ